jgi:DNA-directed RNA polymerase specialized sigma24 family protein
VLAAQSQSPESAQAALATFCQMYWPPLYTFVRRRGHQPNDAQDLVQAFFAHMLEENTLSRASRERGRLRTFLLGSLQNFLANEYHHSQRLKRGGGRQIVSMDDQLIAAEAAIVASSPTDETAGYDKNWASAVLKQAWERLENAMIAGGKKELIDVLKPFVLGGVAVPPSQEEAAAGLRMPISSFRNALLRLRQRYRECLRAEVARTVSDTSEIDEETHYLLRVLVS